jgi:hypothetical protein
MRMKLIQIAFFFALSCTHFWCRAQDSLQVSRPFYVTAGVGQLITVDHGLLRIPTATGAQVTAGTGPLGRVFIEGYASIHRMLGASQAIKNGYLKSYGARVGIIPFKPVPIYFFAGFGIHIYDITYQKIEAAGITILPSIREKNKLNYRFFGASYRFCKNLEAELAYRTEPFWIPFSPYKSSTKKADYSYLSIGVNYWINKYNKFPAFKRTYF